MVFLRGGHFCLNLVCRAVHCTALHISADHDEGHLKQYSSIIREGSGKPEVRNVAMWIAEHYGLLNIFILEQ